MRLWLGAVFFLSGGVALVYQLVWQRALFVMYGLDVVSVTLVVTSFLLGLGLAVWLVVCCPVPIPTCSCRCSRFLSLE